MKALVLNAIGRGFDFEDVDIATPIGHEVLVEVQASGLCHTDLLFATHDFVPTPAVLGHEVAGIVSAVGPDVAQIRVGDHVVGSLALEYRKRQCRRHYCDLWRRRRWSQRRKWCAHRWRVENHRHRHPDETTRRGTALRRNRHH
jgi:Zn-dependent alcohol dehydrogenase